jgi:acylphosphatase
VSDAKLSRRYYVSGTVQGVGFRYFTQNAARKLRLSGFVRNLPDGRVEVFATGTLSQLEKLRLALHSGPAFSNVSDVQELDAENNAQFEDDFVITSGH